MPINRNPRRTRTAMLIYGWLALCLMLFSGCVSRPQPATSAPPSLDTLLSAERITALEQRWGDAIERFDADNQHRAYPADAILFTGSSSIRLWTSMEADLAPYVPIQRGFGGSDSPALAVFAERILLPHPVRGVVVFTANDIIGRENDASVDEILPFIDYIIRVARMRDPMLPVFYIAITPSESRWQAWPHIRLLNEAIARRMDSDPNLQFVATEHAFLNEQGLPRSELFRDDRLHLNEAGYAVWSGLIRSALDAVY